MASSASITIIDYGSGNLHSISKALMRLGADVLVSGRPDDIAAARKLVLPGVGHFGDAMGELHKRGLVQPIRTYAASQRPFLGVCVGLQLLMEASEEAPGVEGLGIIPGACQRFHNRPGMKVPHMGWNRVNIRRRCPILTTRPIASNAPGNTTNAQLDDSPWFYFVHSYFAVPTDPRVVAGSCHYGEDFAAVLWQDNVQATQFHPEKSQNAGLSLLSNFVEQPC